MYKIFIVVHSNLSYIQFVKASRTWLSTIPKDLQILHSYTFKISKNTYKRLLNHTRITITQQDISCRLRKPPDTHKAWERSNLSDSTTLPTSNTFSKLQTQAKCSKNWSKINLHQLQTIWTRKREISRFQEQFCAKKWSSCLSFENHNTYSQIVTKFNRLIFKSIGWFT